MWNTEIESKIVEHGRRKERKELNLIRDSLLRKHHEVNFMLGKFMQEYGEKIDTDTNCMDLFKHLSDEYNATQRLLTILSAYDR